MAGIIVPQDRTTSQKLRGYCFNPKCLVKGERFEFDSEQDLFACPKCGANTPPMVGLLTLIHLLVPDKNGGIEGGDGQCYKIACDTTRAYIATATNLEAGSGEVSAVNCPGCLATKEAKGTQRVFGQALVLDTTKKK